MLESCIYNLLDPIIPSTDASKHKILRLEYLSACKIMKNYAYTMKIHKHIPAKLFEPLLQSVIYQCYLKFINSFDISTSEYYSSLTDIDILFPEDLEILILNWPYEDLILRNQITPLCPPVDIFPSPYSELASQKQAICQVEDLLTVFHIFCNKLIKFITHIIFKCTPANTQGISCNLRRLDVSGLVNVGLYTSYLLSDDILEGVNDSSIDTFGHKIDIVADAVDISERGKEFELLRNIIEQSLKPDVGISVYFKEISIMASIVSSTVDSPTGLYNNLALGRCEYIQLYGYGVNTSFVENLCHYLPGLVGLSLPSTTRIDIENLDFLSAFTNLEQLSLKGNTMNGLMNSICNMSIGLKYLDLYDCEINSQDLECLANSMHSNTLLQLNLIQNYIETDNDAVGLITLCQNLKNIKVLVVDDCALDTLSSNSMSKLANAFKACSSLEFLSMRHNPFNLQITTMIIDDLAQNMTLRYLGLNLPEVYFTNHDRLDDSHDDDYEDVKYPQNLCEKFHEKINRFRQSPIFISWVLT